MISLTSPVRTRAHGWPAGVKLALLCGATVVLFYLNSVVGQVIGLAFCVLLYALPGRVFLRNGLSRLSFVWIFVAVIAIWHLLSGELAMGAVIVLRLITMVGLANLVTMTTRLDDMIAVIHWLATPLNRLGLRSRPLEIAIALVIRFVPVLAAKSGELRLAWQARSAKRLGWRVVFPLTLLAIDDAEHIAEALRARGGML